MMTAVLAEAAPRGELDAAIGALRVHADAWAQLAPGKKIRYLVSLRRRTAQVAEEWVGAAARAKGIPDGSPLVGEEWLSGPWAVLFALNRLIETMSAIARQGTPALTPAAVRTRAGGQVVVDVFPQTLYDRLLVGGVSVEVWMQPDVTPQTLAGTMAVAYKRPLTGRVALVLGAGNIASIPALESSTSSMPRDRPAC